MLGGFFVVLTRAEHPNCVHWADAGECNANPVWMLENCASSCRSVQAVSTEHTDNEQEKLCEARLREVTNVAARHAQQAEIYASQLKEERASFERELRDTTEDAARREDMLLRAAARREAQLQDIVNSLRRNVTLVEWVHKKQLQDVKEAAAEQEAELRDLKANVLQSKKDAQEALERESQVREELAVSSRRCVETLEKRTTEQQQLFEERLQEVAESAAGVVKSGAVIAEGRAAKLEAELNSARGQAWQRLNGTGERAKDVTMFDRTQSQSEDVMSVNGGVFPFAVRKELVYATSARGALLEVVGVVLDRSLLLLKDAAFLTAVALGVDVAIGHLTEEMQRHALSWGLDGRGVLERVVLDARLHLANMEELLMSVWRLIAERVFSVCLMDPCHAIWVEASTFLSDLNEVSRAGIIAAVEHAFFIVEQASVALVQTQPEHEAWLPKPSNSSTIVSIEAASPLEFEVGLRLLLDRVLLVVWLATFTYVALWRCCCVNLIWRVFICTVLLGPPHVMVLLVRRLGCCNRSRRWEPGPSSSTGEF